MSNPTRTRVSVLLAVGLGLGVAACGPSATSGPNLVASTPTSLATTTAPPAPAAASTAALPTVAAATSAPPTVVALSTSPPVSRSATVKLVVDPAASQARYHAHEQLVGKPLPSEAVGTSDGVSGSLVLAADGAVDTEQSKITVDLSRLQSDESRRDNFIKNSTLQTSQYPLATFVPSSVQDLSLPLPTSGESTFQLLGDLTVHGVTRPVTWQVTAQFSDQIVTGNATAAMNISDFGMSPPKAGPVLSIEDGITLELAFSAARS